MRILYKYLFDILIYEYNFSILAKALIRLIAIFALKRSPLLKSIKSAWWNFIKLYNMFFHQVQSYYFPAIIIQQYKIGLSIDSEILVPTLFCTSISVSTDFLPTYWRNIFALPANSTELVNVGLNLLRDIPVVISMPHCPGGLPHTKQLMSCSVCLGEWSPLPPVHTVMIDNHHLLCTWQRACYKLQNTELGPL